ncbi:TetR/AcrR family transcriptional regulator [Variovorax sp. LjRoot290]|uniref:TetR/AcrR family transcriptional regulator n=1 Tax=Variovorax sp. LjRoot290 TaxID=3342316 RepID=UPI003ECECD99
MDAALALFVEKGFAGSRAEDIAARAGVSKATLYLYFASKDDLLKRLIADGFASHVGIGEREAEDDVASGELLRDALTAWRSALMEGDAGGILKLVCTEVRSFPELADLWSRDLIEPVRRLVSRLVLRGIARGEFRRVDPDVVVYALVSPLIVMCLHRHAISPHVAPDSLTSFPELFSQHFEFVLEGLIQRPP